MIKLPQFLSFLCVLFWFSGSSQHQQLLDSLRPISSYERRRVVFGYAEAHADLLSKKERRLFFLKQIKDFAILHKDQALINDVDFMKRKQIAVMDFPRIEREKKLIQFITNHDKTTDLFFLGFCYHELGQINFQNGEYTRAFENDLKALEVYDKIGFNKVPNIGKVLHEVALHYYFFRDYEEVIRLMNISLQFPPFNKQLDIQRYNNLAVSYMKMKKYDKASYFFYKGLDLAKKYRSHIWIGILSGNIGELYYNQEDYKHSLFFYQQNFEYNNDDLYSAVKMKSTTNMVKVYVKLDSIQKAREFLNISERIFSRLDTMTFSYQKARHLGDQQQLEVAKKQYFEAKIDYLKSTGDFRSTVKYQDSLVKIGKKLEGTYNSAVGMIASHKLMIQKKELQLIQKKQEKANQQLVYIILISIVLILASIGYWHLYRSKQKKKRQNERLINLNRVSILEKRKTEQELNATKIEVFLNINKVNEHSKIIVRLENELVQIKKTEIIQKKQIAEVLHKLKTMKILTDEDWHDFQRNFEMVYPEFINALRAYTPAMTASEMRYLMLTKLGLTNKEMAGILGVSDAAIRVVWNRLRKKLNLTLEDTSSILIERIIKSYEVTEAFI